jgi:hypothetical protein
MAYNLAPIQSFLLGMVFTSPPAVSLLPHPLVCQIQVNSDCGEDSCRLSDGGTSTSTVDELDATAIRHHRM